MSTELRRVAILGSTGSIGRQALQVIEAHPGEFVAHALAAGTDSQSLRQQVSRFRPALACVSRSGSGAWDFPATRLLLGEENLATLAQDPEADIVLVATPGKIGLVPTVAALEAGKPVALVNKEALVMAGHLVMEASRKSGAPILPVDSEHSAVWQCLRGEGDNPQESIRRIVLTASGGALRDLSLEQIKHATPSQALQHPTWKMGPKVTVDSATLMNKGLEIIEAAWLFGVPVQKVEVVVHRESIVHSLVEFVDGSVKAQLAIPDMRIPIQYALTYPRRLSGGYEPLDLTRIRTLSFEPVDPSRYPCVDLARKAAELGGSYTSVLCGANEEAVLLFLRGLVTFDRIPELVEQALIAHTPAQSPTLGEVLQADAWAREQCRRAALKAAV